ncbi:MAG: type 1 glutamine amidotransferase domain-containing protein [Candidatus Bathyarchaeota archaeon]|jgi:protease I
MLKVAVLVENGFEDIELLYPYYRYQEAGFEVKVVGPKAGETYKGKKGGSIKSTISPEGVNLDEYAAIVIPGGWAPDRMRTKPGLVKLVKEANIRGLVISAICHAAQLLVEADIVRGKKLTCVKSVSTDVKNAGGEYVDEEVVVDDNLVTSRYPLDIPVWCRETLKIVNKG